MSKMKRLTLDLQDPRSALLDLYEHTESLRIERDAARALVTQTADDERERIINWLTARGCENLARELIAGMSRPVDWRRIDNSRLACHSHGVILADRNGSSERAGG